MTMIDDDEAGLKEKPEDTRYIKRIHRNETRSTGNVGKLNRIDLIPNFMPSLGTVDSEMPTTKSNLPMFDNSQCEPCKLLFSALLTIRASQL